MSSLRKKSHIGSVVVRRASFCACELCHEFDKKLLLISALKCDTVIRHSSSLNCSGCTVSVPPVLKMADCNSWFIKARKCCCVLFLFDFKCRYLSAGYACLFEYFNGYFLSKWFEPRTINSSYSVIVRVSVVLKRTVVGD